MADFEQDPPKTKVGTNADLEDRFKDIVGELVNSILELQKVNPEDQIRLEQVLPEQERATQALLDAVASTIILDPM